MDQKERDELLRTIADENVVIFHFMRAVIATHHSPRALVDAFNLTFNQLVGGLLADASATDESIARLQAQRNRLVGDIEARLRGGGS